MNEERNPFEMPGNDGQDIPAEEVIAEAETDCEEIAGNEENVIDAEIISETEETTEVSAEGETTADPVSAEEPENEEQPDQENDGTKKKKKKNKVLDALLALCIVGLMISGYFLMADILPRIENRKNIKDIQQVSPILDTESDPTKIPSIEYLKEINKDIIGWINIPGTNIDYPILQCSNNDYYLQYSYNEKWNDAGSIFLDCENDDDFTDQNSVIYGHARYDGSMFAQVLYYKKQSQYNKAPFITIVLEGKVYYYQIFSANIVEAVYNYRESDYGDDFMDFIRTMRKSSMIKSSAKVNADSRIITLSTCTNVIENGRLALLAVLLNPDGEKIDLNDYPL